MKKVKIMLTAITVLAVVGGALAFKAHSITGGHYCSTVSGNSGVCQTTQYRIQPIGFEDQLYCTTEDKGTCGTTLEKIVQDN